MCWGMGILLSSGVIRACQPIDGDLGWRLPFALQWIWPIPLFFAAWFAPESPWNSVRRGKLDEAKNSLMRLSDDADDKAERVEMSLAYIRYITEMEKAESQGASFFELFKGTNLRRTEIVSPTVTKLRC
jgi:MFS transporter, SP family, general alpha glucoside:H+ symporter